METYQCNNCGRKQDNPPGTDKKCPECKRGVVRAARTKKGTVLGFSGMQVTAEKADDKPATLSEDDLVEEPEASPKVSNRKPGRAYSQNFPAIKPSPIMTDAEPLTPEPGSSGKGELPSSFAHVFKAIGFAAGAAIILVAIVLLVNVLW